MEFASLSTTPLPAGREIILQPQAPLPVADRSGADAQTLILAVLLIAFFMAPTWLAARGRRWSVGLVNILIGWTVIGWGIALILAVRSREAEAARGAK